MPSNFLTADTSFPDLSGNKSTNEKFEQLSSYLFMLLEQLRYSLANLGQENFNETAFQDIAMIIRKPVYIQLENTDKQVAALSVTAEGLSSRLGDAEGNISQLSQAATGLSSRVEDAEGNISQLSQTATGLLSRVEDAEGNISQLGQTVNGLLTRVEDTEGNISQLSQTANGLSTRVEDAEGNISELLQTTNGLSSRVEDAEGNITLLSQTVNGLSLTVDNGSSTSTIALVSNGIAISSQSISFSGMVVFSDLSRSGRSTINGDNITTGTISAITISACDVNSSVFRTNLAANGTIGGEIEMCYTGDQYVAGGIRLDDQGAGTAIESKYRMFIYTNSVKGVPFALKLESAGSMSFESQEAIYMSAATSATLIGEETAYVSGKTVNVYGPTVTIGRADGTSTVNIKGTVYINGELYSPAE